VEEIVISHVRLGLVGALVGLLAVLVLWSLGVGLPGRSPLLVGALAMFFGLIAGLLLGGLVSLRPDQDAYIHATRRAIKRGYTSVVVHALNRDQRNRAAQFLSGRGAQVTRSL
jgi:hypothetical protein